MRWYPFPSGPRSRSAVSGHSRFAIFARVGLLPLALVLGTVLGLGSYAETNDDPTLAWLFAGVLALQPVPAVPLYFHGFGHALAALYAARPAVAWLGLLQGGLLAGATGLFFAVLDRLLRPYLRPGPLALVLALFFGLAWLEHWLWFSHARVVVLLAGGSVLFAAQRPASRRALLLGLLGLAAAWLLRPSLALLAFGAVLPAAGLLAGGWRRAAPVLASAALGLGLATGAAVLLQTSSAARYQVRDSYFARILDFEQLRAQPRTPVDSLGTAAISSWLLGDSTAVAGTLGRQVYHFDAPDFLLRVAPAKLRLRASLLARDYFTLLLSLAATAVVVVRLRIRRAGFWAIQLGYLATLALIASLLKLPPRLALPLLDFWLLTNVAFLLKKGGVGDVTGRSAVLVSLAAPVFAPQLRRLGMVLAGGIVLLYAAKTYHRWQVLSKEQRHHEAALVEITRRTAGRVRVLAGTNDLLKSLSPFRSYSLGPGPVLLLSGWSAHDPSQPCLRQRLAGTADQTACLRHLAQPGSGARWVLSAETARWLNRRFRYPVRAGPAVVLRPGSALAADTTLRYYLPGPR